MISARTDLTRCAATFAAVAAMTMTTLACTSMGTGTGSVEPGDTPVAFDWTSKDGGATGTMSASVGKGAAFSGPFLQITSTVRTDDFDPIWTGWSSGWNDWGGGGDGSDWDFFPGTPAFSTRYSGTVVANLKGPDSQRLRCRFHLNDPVAGMRGGGQGQCQFTGGRTVDAVFPQG